MKDEVEPSSDTSEYHQHHHYHNNSQASCYADELLPVYPGPVGKRLKWNFVDNSNESNSSNQGNNNAEGSSPSHQNRTLTLDLLPDGVQNNNNNNNINRSHTIITTMSSTTTGHNNQNAANRAATAGYHIGLYGWRKKCLFILIFGLMLLIIVNLALTLWILKVMEFTSEGMGQLKVVAGGLQLSGQALVLDMLRASTIRSRHGQPISIESSRNFSINTHDWEGRMENSIFLGHDKFEVHAHHLKIVDVHGGILFAADKNEVVIGANSLHIDGDGGALFRESVQTPVIRAEPGRELKFESPTRSLHINAGQDIFIKSAAGSLDATCLNDIRLHSEAGSIRLDSPSILIPNLRTAQPPQPSATQTHDHAHKVYQLCACANGKLFLAQSHSICAGDEATVCR